MSYNNCRKRFFEKNRFFHRIHYNIRVKMGQYPPLLSTFFRQWTIDPERNRWVGREFVSPQIMEIEIYPSSTIVRRYVYLSRVGGLAYRGKETVLLRNTYETFFEGKPEIYYYQWNLEYLDLKRRIFR